MKNRTIKLTREAAVTILTLMDVYENPSSIPDQLKQMYTALYPGCIINIYGNMEGLMDKWPSEFEIDITLEEERA